MGISEINKNFVKNKIDDVLGLGRNLGKGEIQYYCPFCSHHKPKLQVNLETQKWRCWVCNAKGLRIPNLLRKLNVEFSIIDSVKKIYGETVYRHQNETDEEFIEISLPTEYKTILEYHHH